MAVTVPVSSTSRPVASLAVLVGARSLPLEVFSSLAGTTVTLSTTPAGELQAPATKVSNAVKIINFLSVFCLFIFRLLF
jgi:hypothetical protein